ncbi:hypothetical protein GCM10027034_13370 [Ramlibacter solisilvae]
MRELLKLRSFMISARWLLLFASEPVCVLTPKISDPACAAGLGAAALGAGAGLGAAAGLEGAGLGAAVTDDASPVTGSWVSVLPPPPPPPQPASTAANSAGMIRDFRNRVPLKAGAAEARDLF